MRRYNVVALLKSQNPEIVNKFDSAATAVQFDPNKGANCIRIIYPDGSAKIDTTEKVITTYRYSKTKSENGVYECGKKAIIVTNNGHLVLDLNKDEVNVFLN